jgi:hypothetical protein
LVYETIVPPKTMDMTQATDNRITY